MRSYQMKTTLPKLILGIGLPIMAAAGPAYATTTQQPDSSNQSKPHLTRTNASPVQRFILPARGYFRPDAPIRVIFATAATHLPAALWMQFGFAATQTLAHVHVTAPSSLFSPAGLPQFHLYTLGGKSIAPQKIKPPLAASKPLNLARLFPQIESAGTYILTWKNATPLVIETLDNPGFNRAALAQIPASQIASLSPAQKKEMMLQFKPVAIHVMPLAYAKIKTSKGSIAFKFWYDEAPNTVDNFIALARQRFYDGSNFHRIIKGFMIQGGDSVSNIPGRAGTGGPGYNLAAEFNDRLFVRGVVAMARSQSPDSAGSQFFIMQAANSGLDGQYTGFGQVISGMKVVDTLANTPVSDDNGTVAGPKPTIISIHILPATLSIYFGHGK